MKDSKPQEKQVRNNNRATPALQSITTSEVLYAAGTGSLL